MKQLKNILFVLAISILLTGCGENPYDQAMEQLEAGKYEEAATYFEQAVEKKKNLADSYRGLGLVRWEMKDYEGAKEALLFALEEGTKETATINAMLGNCEFELGNVEEAIAYYEKVISSEDADAGLVQDAEYNTIAAYEKLMDMETAKAKLAEYIEKYPDDEEALREAEFLETR